MLDERTGKALQTRDESGSTSSPTMCHPGVSRRRAIGSIAMLVAFIFLSACTDYVQQIEDRYGEWETSDDVLSSSSGSMSSSTEGRGSSSSSVAKSSSSNRHSGLDPESSSSVAKLSSSSVVKSSSSQKAVSSSSVKVTKPAEVTLGSITDSRDGQTYKTVKIGSQIWMAENLNYKTENSWCGGGNGTAEGDCSKYGRLYTWAAAMDSAGIWRSNGKGCGYNKTCSPEYPVQGVCPSGWHLPSRTEWNTLFSAVGRQSIAGYVLKATSGWNEHDGQSGNGADSFSFSAIPAGRRDGYGTFEGVGNYALFWNSTEYNRYAAYGMYLNHDVDNADLDGGGKYYSFSIRCLKNDESEQYATSSSSVAKSSSSDKVTEPTGETVGSMTDSRDGQKYKTVKIGIQIWMAQNLNYETTNSYCNNNCTKYGRLYTWAAATSACPSGWHLPSRTEWEKLFSAVGGSSTAGTKLKSTSGWYSSGNGTDAFSFSALPAGGYFLGSYVNEGKFANFWSSTEFDSDYAYNMYLNYDNDYAGLSNYGKDLGFSVRCLKD